MKDCKCLDGDRFFNHIRCDEPQPLEADPIHMFTLVEAQKVCDEELVADYPDYDRYAEARLRIEELDPPRTVTVKDIELKQQRKKEESTILWLVMLCGMAILIFQCFFGNLEPWLIVVGAGMMGLPAVTSDARLGCALYGLLAMTMAFGFHQEAKTTDARAAKVKQVRIEYCHTDNILRREIKLPPLDCKGLIR